MTVFLSTILVTSAFVFMATPSVTAKSRQPNSNHMSLSEAGLSSHFGQVNDAGQGGNSPLSQAAVGQDNQGNSGGGGKSAVGVVNNDYNKRPQDEPAVAANPSNPANLVVGANDYGIGTPVGGGVYFTFSGAPGTFTDYYPPFPLLYATDYGIAEPPAGTGDPGLAFGTTRTAGGIAGGLPVVYYTSLGFSYSFFENGVFIFRSLDGGVSWTRPVVPPLAPPSGLRTVTYWPYAGDGSVFNDKPYLAVDNTGGPHNGRIYVTWTQFLSDSSGIPYHGSPIMMAYSDDNGNTFSSPIEISGSSATLCSYPGYAPNAGHCNENQFSSPVVGSDGRLYVAFENEMNDPSGNFRDQYLVTVVNPDTFAVSGPYQVSSGFANGLLADGATDYPYNHDGRQTLCNSNFRVNSAGNLAIGPNGDLYATWSDNRQHAGEFSFPTFVGASPDFACPAGTDTATGVFVSKSTDNGKTWTFLGNVNPSSSGDHWFPRVAVDQKSGKVGVVFYDRSADPSNRAAATTLITSSNGGSSWQAQTVSAFASDFTYAFGGTGRFIGDYNNLAFDSMGRAIAVWTGMTPGKDTDIYMSITSPNSGNSGG